MNQTQILKMGALDRRWLASLLADAEQTGREVRVAWDGGLKVKVGGGMWSAPMGHQE